MPRSTIASFPHLKGRAEGGDHFHGSGEGRDGRSWPAHAGEGADDRVAMVIVRESERCGGVASSVRPN
jgi:hypothetical protein